MTTCISALPYLTTHNPSSGISSPFFPQCFAAEEAYNVAQAAARAGYARCAVCGECGRLQPPTPLQATPSAVHSTGDPRRLLPPAPTEQTETQEASAQASAAEPVTTAGLYVETEKHIRQEASAQCSPHADTEAHATRTVTLGADDVVACHTCGVVVHAGCYGIASERVATPWACDRCEAVGPTPVVSYLRQRESGR